MSAVIPARDEAARIGPCVLAARADPGVSEVIVVDDVSTDGTAAVAARPGAHVRPENEQGERPAGQRPAGKGHLRNES